MNHVGTLLLINAYSLLRFPYLKKQKTKPNPNIYIFVPESDATIQSVILCLRLLVALATSQTLYLMPLRNTGQIFCFIFQKQTFF